MDTSVDYAKHMFLIKVLVVKIEKKRWDGSRF